MKTYTVELRETHVTTRYVDVEAKNEEDAWNKATDEYEEEYTGREDVDDYITCEVIDVTEE